MKRLTLTEFQRAFCIGEVKTGPRGATHYPGTSAGEDASSIDSLLPEGFREVGEWRDGWYRVVWVHDTERCIITYCEGDISVQLCPTQEIYDAELAYCAAFYEDH